LRAPRKSRAGMRKAKVFIDKGDSGAFYGAIQKTLEEYLGNKFDMPKGSVTPHEISAKLVSSGAQDEIIRKLNDVLSVCEMARYASSAPESADLVKILDDTRRIIDHVEKL